LYNAANHFFMEKPPEITGHRRTAMPQTVEAIYHDGIVELKRKPFGIRRAKALVVFLDNEVPEKRHVVNLGKVNTRKSSVDKWVGVIEGAELGDWKTERRTAMEGKTL
jgi:hypothetical protein